MQDWAGSARSAFEATEPVAPPSEERRSEDRHDCGGLKLIIRERRGLGIIHLRNVSTWGASGITDLPVAVGSLVFLELKKGHFYSARVKWVRRLTIGLQLVRQMQPEALKRLLVRRAKPSGH